MSHRRLLVSMAALLACASGFAAPAPPAASPAAPPAAKPAPPVEPANSQLTRAQRLNALKPEAPLQYFELAEDVAGAPVGLDDLELARRLYVLSAVLATDGKHPADAARSPEWLPASACLGLAALAENEQERRWLRALAGTFAPEESRVALKRSVEAAAVDAPAQELAAALDALRAGFGLRAAKLMERPGVSDLLEKYERLLTPDGRPGGAARVRSLITRYPICKECRNERAIKDKDGVHLCPSCGGRPGPKLEGDELVGQLRLESLLVSGIQRSWAAQVIADEGAPLRELDIASLADAYHVEPAKVWWREGRWAASPSTEPAGDKGETIAPAPPALPR